MTKSGESDGKPVHRVELRLRDIAQLFNSMDPTPFHHKDLDPDAEEFIESWALEFPPGGRYQITIHLEQMPAEGDPTALVNEALHNYFEYRAGVVRRELRQLLRQGRISLVIGIAFLALCLLTADAMGKLATGPFLSIVRESLTIGGWVGMWRPLQIFLYDWWPLRRSSRTYKDLSRAHVRILSGSGRGGPARSGPTGQGGRSGVRFTQAAASHDRLPLSSSTSIAAANGSRNSQTSMPIGTVPKTRLPQDV